MIKVAFQGEPGAYSEAAGKLLFGQSTRMVPCEEFPGVFESVKKGLVQFGIVPIENSLAGSIHQNYDLLFEYQFQIHQEVYLRVEHVLMMHKQSKLSQLKKVLSHPQALSQCSQFLRSQKHLKAVAYYDTAGAAKMVAEEPGDACAIASMYAAKLYNLKPLHRNIENNHQNFTRFLAISKKKSVTKRTENMKTSILFSPKKNETGVLFRMLGVLSLRNINLLKIESRPLPLRTFEYCFYLDFAGDLHDKSVKAAIDQLREMSSDLIVFGSYPVGQRVKMI